MRKVKIIYSNYMIDHYDDYYTNAAFYPAAGDWEEVTDAEYAEMVEAVQYANMKDSRHGKYFIVEYSDGMRETVFKTGTEFKQKMLEQKRKEEERREEERRKREEKALERKRKQLEKLQKELGEL